ncbi:MAG: 2-oxoglutarate dehydrogenase E1 component [Lentisphaeraceae bacterium]|nr:2-oxoglutarate dehydrogenase E1 component [Lentisphaeraceae bacterium]
MYSKYKEDPNSVDPTWQQFFDGYQYADTNSLSNEEVTYTDKQVRVMKLISAYRDRGHLIAKTNPVRPRRLHQSALNIEYFGLEESDLDTEFDVGNEIRIGRAKLRDIIHHLEDTYCSSIGAEYRYIPNSQIRQWLHEEMEGIGNNPTFTTVQKTRILTKLAEAIGFEKFLHVKYVGQKRFSLEGIEAVVPALDALFEEGARLGVREVVMGMAHRGRLNILTNLFKKKFQSLFTEFEGGSLPEDIRGDGDVKYHMGNSADIVTSDGHELHLSLAANPSHLEAVAPVVLGNCRAKWEKVHDRDHSKIVPIILHGDAAISGQGVVYEIAQFASLDGYAAGGVIHVVLNNQVGFTANYRESRSSLYCTDIAKVLNSPVFHVNADDPEAVVHVCQMAIKLRQKFGIDVYIDILGYRRHGHNEGDEPRFTQPLLYDSIRKHKSVLDIYADSLIKGKDITEDEFEKITKDFNDYLQECLADVRSDDQKNLEVNYLGKQWQGYRGSTQEDFETSPETGVELADLKKVATAITTVPDSFNLLPKMRKLVDGRRKDFFDKENIDWGMAEMLAYGTLLQEKHPVRLSGQDSRRGTFSHRHSVLIDAKDEQEHVLLNHIDKDQEIFQAYNSHLSEYGVLGFEYGYSIATPAGLTIWEAQFGDFANGAQVVFDQFISASESKWLRMSGLVCFMPHGYEGQGPEHSSARLERFLNLAAENNMIVANPTTPANFYHLLRRQVKVKYRLPLMVMSPKSLLRHPLVRSDVSELTDGRFQETIDDAAVTDASKIDRVLLCSGKIYYELLKKKEEGSFDNVAIVRIEQFYPTPKDQDKALAEKYKDANDWIWVQEEPQNMGGWYFMRARLDAVRRDVDFISRKKSASPAHGSNKKEMQYQQNIIDRAFTDITPKTIKK